MKAEQETSHRTQLTINEVCLQISFYPKFYKSTIETHP